MRQPELDPRVAAGHADENRVADALKARGWGVCLFGIRVWDPRTSSTGNAVLWEAVRSSRWPLRHAPDLLAGHPEKGLALVEVIVGKGREQRCLEIAKLHALDAWRHVAPVAVVDTADWSAWAHSPQWPYLAETDVTRHTRNGSGDPYAWFSRQSDRPFDDLFGVPDDQSP